MVYDGYRKGRKVAHGNIDDLWEELWDIWEEVYNAGWIILLHKVKSHTSIAQIGFDIKHEDRTGNALADHWAGKGALIGRDPDLDLNVNQRVLDRSRIDAKAWLIQARAVAVCQKYLVHSERDDTSEKLTGSQKAIQKLEELGHIPVKVNDTWKCTICLNQWSAVSQALDRRCPGPSNWYPPLADGVIWKAKQGAEILVKGQQLHPTHTIHWCRGVYYCCKCGCYTVKRVENLKRLCLLRPILPSQADRLKRLEQGLFPLRHGAWPLAADSTPL